MVHFSPKQIRSVLETGEFDQLVVAVEHEQMDAKSEPYRLGDLRAKLELAKDVAGFANAAGGVIVIGARRTEKSPVHFGDEIREIRPFDRGLIGRVEIFTPAWLPIVSSARCTDGLG